MADSFDLVVIGGGPAGYVGAIRAAQLGLKVACVERRDTLGGTCVNVGCIPSKALLQSSHLFAEVQHSLAPHGIIVEGARLDLAAMQKRKTDVVSASTKGLDFLVRKNKIERHVGSGRIAAAGRVIVSDATGRETATLDTRNILLATGSEVTPLPGVPIDENRIVSSTGALALTSVPKHLVVIGAGIIGLELGSVWRRLGAEVTVVEFLYRIAPGIDSEVVRTLQRALEKQGLKFRLGTKVTGAAGGASGVSVICEPVKGGAPEQIEAEIVLVAIGRRPHIEGLGLEAAGVTLTPRGRIAVDHDLRTSVPGIWAVGDVIDGPMLAHKASEDAVACVETIAGQKGHVDWGKVPSILYTQPEVAWVGRSEDELKAVGVAYRSGKYPFSADPRSRANGHSEGFVKVLADKATDEVLGVHIIGAEAGTMIAEAVTAMEFRASAEDIGRICQGHPTVSDALKEAALAAWDKPIHF